VVNHQAQESGHRRPRLRTAIAAAKAENMPNDNIDRAVRRGTGQIPGLVLEEAVFEGYGPGGVAILVETTTDNRTRTVNELRHIFSKWSGNLGEPGCVAWMFDKKAYLSLPKEKVDEDTLMAIVLDAGADDLRDDGSSWEIIGPPGSLEPLKAALAESKLEAASAEATMLPQNTVPVEKAHASHLFRLLEALDEHDDVQRVYANFDLAEKEIEEALAASD
jgi:YebC/PmpR family DNA-binding regulatory protein